MKKIHIICSLLLSMLLFIHCKEETSTPASLDKIPYFKKQYELCNSGGDFDVNAYCQNISYNYVDQCLETAKQVCQESVLCTVDKLLELIKVVEKEVKEEIRELPVITDPDQKVDKLSDIKIIDDINKFLFGKAIKVKEYNDLKTNCRKEGNIKLRSFIETNIAEGRKPD